MSTVKVLTANIGYGLPGMDRLTPSLKHQLHIHGWGALTYEILPPLRGRIAAVSEARRVAYVGRHKDLGATTALIQRVSPDVLVLNEVIFELYRDELERALADEGFQTIAWGLSTHYPGTTLSTLVATKAPGAPIPCTMPQRPSMGGGAGIAGIKLNEMRASVFGVHLTYRSPKLFIRQMQYVANVAAGEKACGNDVIVAGDWNECEATITANVDFKTLGLSTATQIESATCPTFFPPSWRKSLDHVFMPSHWRRVASDAIAFGSDHLAIAAEVEYRPAQPADGAHPRRPSQSGY